MLTSPFKFILRTLWRNRFFTALNIVGLSVGLAAAWAAFQIVAYEFSFDRAHPRYDRTYRISSWFTFDGKENGNSGIPTPLAKAAEELVGVEMAVPVFDRYVNTVTVPGIGGSAPKVFEDEQTNDIVATDGRYFQLTPYEWLAGSPATALSAPNQLVLTRERAAQYFPGFTPEQMLGQTILHNDTITMVVTGVVAELPYPSTFLAKEMRTIDRKELEDQQRWGGVSSSSQLFLLLAANTDPKTLEKQINHISEENSREMMAQWGGNITRNHVLQRLDEVHFATQFGGHIRSANKKILYSIAGVAAFLLLLAIINYINLATAQMPQRAREIGIRKTLGGQKSGAITRFLMETAVVTTISVVLAGGTTQWLLTAFQEVVPTDDNLLRFVRPLPMLGFGAAMVVVVSLLSGIYPGWLAANVQAVRLMRGQVTETHRAAGSGALLRKGLIVFQFAISQLLLLAAFVVGLQTDFLLRQDLGFDREAVVMVDIPWKILQKKEFAERHFVLAESLKKLPEVSGVSLGEPLFSGNYSNNNHQYKNEKGQVIDYGLFRKFVDTAAIGMYNMSLLAGRNLMPSDTVREYVINETAVTAFGLGSPQEAIGQILQENNGNAYPIVGVVRDFHALSAYEKINPTALMSSRDQMSTLSIKLAGNNSGHWEKAFRKIEVEWQKLYPAVPFEYKFYDEMLAEIYAEDRKTATLAKATMAIALLICCLGLLGLSTFTTLRRSKEIGIRKILGASSGSVIGLLTREFLWLVVLAIVLTAPLGWWLMQQYLENFAYRIELAWWIFGAAGLVAVFIALFTVSFQTVRAALANPVESLRSE